MGISVTNGWRLKRGVDFWEFVRSAGARARVGACDGLGSLLTTLEDEFSPESHGWEAFLQREGSPEKAKRAEARHRLQEEFKKQISSSLRNRFDLEIAMTFVKEQHTGALIFRACAGDAVRGAFDFLRRDERVASFNFWTQSSPTRIAEKEWERRRAFWSAWDGRPDRVTCEVVAPWNVGRLLALYDRRQEAFED